MSDRKEDLTDGTRAAIEDFLRLRDELHQDDIDLLLERLLGLNPTNLSALNRAIAETWVDELDTKLRRANGSDYHLQFQVTEEGYERFADEQQARGGHLAMSIEGGYFIETRDTKGEEFIGTDAYMGKEPLIYFTRVSRKDFKVHGDGGYLPVRDVLRIKIIPPNLPKTS